MKKILDNVIKYFPIITAATFFISILRVAFFYYLFGINIIPLLEISESVLYMVEFIPLLVSTTLFAVVIVILITPKDTFASNREVIINRRKAYSSNTKTRLKHYFFTKPSLLIFGCAAFGIICYYIFKESYFLALGFMPLPLWTFRIIYFEVALKLNQQTNREIFLNTAIAIFLLVFMFTKVFVDYREVLKGGTKGTSIGLKSGRLLVSSDTSIYIGKTKNYYFLFQKKSNQIEVIPSEEVSSFKASIK